MISKLTLAKRTNYKIEDDTSMTHHAKPKFQKTILNHKTFKQLLWYVYLIRTWVALLEDAPKDSDASSPAL